MITHEQIPDFYDWLSRYVQLSNWLSYRDGFAAFTMHKRLAVPAEEDRAPGRTAGLEYVNDRLLEVAGLPPGPSSLISNSRDLVLRSVGPRQDFVDLRSGV